MSVRDSALRAEPESTRPSRNGTVEPAREAADAARQPTEFDAPVTVLRRRTWPWIVAGVGLGVAATIGFNELTAPSTDGADSVTTEVVELATAEVSTRDLIGYVDYDGTLARGESVSIAATSSGTITESVPVGSIIGRGSAIASIDAVPVTAFYGSQPFYRDLVSGDEGVDVLQLEANLWALGYTDDGTLSVDGDYDASTTDAVEEWETALGLDETGDFDAGRVVVLDGLTIVSEIATPGTSSAIGQQLLLGETIETRVDITLSALGLDESTVIADLPAVGTPIEQGTVLATIDGQPVFALTDVSGLDAEFLDAFADEDIERVENLLVFFGFDPDGTITADGEVDLATTAAMTRWQESIGLAPTGAIGAPYYVVVPAGLDVTDVLSTPGDPIGAGALAMSLGTPTTSVSADIVVDEIDTIAVGQALEVVLADERILPAKVVSISDTADAATDGSVATVAVSIELDDAPEDLIVGPVTIRFETDRIDQATVVPTRALVSLAEGGFAVEVSAADGSTRLVGIELGAFDDGVVEVLAGDVAVGDAVVVPT